MYTHSCAKPRRPSPKLLFSRIAKHSSIKLHYVRETTNQTPSGPSFCATSNDLRVVSLWLWARCARLSGVLDDPHHLAHFSVERHDDVFWYRWEWKRAEGWRCWRHGG